MARRGAGLWMGPVRVGDRWWRRVRRVTSEQVEAHARRVELLTFRSHAYDDGLPVRGRLVLDRRLPPPGTQAGSTTGRIRAILRRYLSQEVTGAPIRIRWAGPEGSREVRCVTDEGGFFWAVVPGPIPRADAPTWEAVEVERADVGSPRSIAFVQVTGHGSRVGVVSDIDDTVVVTRASRWWSHVATVLSHEPSTRAVFPGMAELYGALHEEQAAPFWYLSSSAWNLADYWEDLFRLRGVPLGAFELRELGAGAVAPDRHRTHKRVRLEEIFKRTELPLILVGDSGQHDARIYTELLREWPERVAAVLIRDLGLQGPGGPVATLLQQAESETGIPCRLARDAVGMAEVLAGAGWLSAEGANRVRSACRALVPRQATTLAPPR